MRCAICVVALGRGQRHGTDQDRSRDTWVVMDVGTDAHEREHDACRRVEKTCDETSAMTLAKRLYKTFAKCQGPYRHGSGCETQ